MLRGIGAASSFASVVAVVAHGYRRLLLPLSFLVGVLVLAGLAGVAIAVPLYLVATRQTVAYNVGVGALLATAVLALAANRIIRGARTSQNRRAYLLTGTGRVLLATGRALLALGVAYLVARAYATRPLVGVAVTAPALVAFGLLAGAWPIRKPRVRKR
jgi:hypothetical protein